MSSVAYHFVANFLLFQKPFFNNFERRRRHVGHARHWHLKGLNAMLCAVNDHSVEVPFRKPVS